MRFKPGQKVVCIHEGARVQRGVDNHGRYQFGAAPSYGDIVTVSDYSWIHT